MNKPNNLRFLVWLGFVLALAGALFAQSTPNKILIVNGKTAGEAVRQIDGRSYVDIETLAQVTNGVVTIEPDRVVLTIPTSDSGDTVSPPPAQSPQGLSRDFAAAAITEIAEMREWRGAIGAMITYGLAVSEAWAQDYSNRVQAGLQEAGVAASTEADQNALQLLQNEADKLASWANGVFAARRALNGTTTVDPNALQNDPALAKIRSCGQFLNTMLVSGAFADDSSCH